MASIWGIRPRILVWYFLLTAASALISIQVTRQIYCDSEAEPSVHRLKTQLAAALVREIERFNQFQQQQIPLHFLLKFSLIMQQLPMNTSSRC